MSSSFAFCILSMMIKLFVHWMAHTFYLMQSVRFLKLICEIKSILETEKTSVAIEVNNHLLRAYWNIGELIVRFEQNDNIRAEYGSQTLKQLSKELTNELGRGFHVQIYKI